MPGNFLNFLQFYMDLPEEKSEEKEGKEEKAAATSVFSLSDAELRKKAVADSREFIKDATTKKDFSLVSRVFNNFPVTFQREDTEQKFEVIEADTFKEWFNRLFDFLNTTTLILDMNEDPPVFKIQGGKELISTLVDDMIMKACEELLDENDDLDARVIDLLQLKKFFDMYEGQPNKKEDLKLRVIYSYVIQIAFGNMLEKLDEKAREKFSLEPELYRKFSKNRGNCTILLTQMFFQSEIITINDKEVAIPSFTPHIKETVRKARHRRLIETPLPEQCAVELANISLENAEKLITADFAKMQLVNEQMKLSQLKQTENITTHRISFWLDVCDFYRRQIENDNKNIKYYQLMVQILLWVQKQTITLTQPYFKKYQDCLAAAGQALPAEQKKTMTIEIPRDSDSIKKINKLLAADINHYVMKELEKTGQLGGFRANQEVIASIKKFMADPDYVQESPEKALAVFVKLASGHSDIQSGMKFYLEAFERVDFYLRIQSDVAMLRSVFKKVGVIKEHRIFNYFRNDSADPDIDISLASCLDKLDEQINELKSKKSAIKFDEWAQKYRGILQAIVDGMFNALSKEMTINMRYIKANEKMSETWDAFLHLASSIRTDINMLNDQTVQTIDIAEWQKKFENNCDRYVKYATRLIEFSATIEKIQAPSEGDLLVHQSALDLKLAYFFREFAMSLSGADKLLVPIIKEYKSSRQMTSTDFFKSSFKGMLIELINDQAQSERLMQAYQDGLARANFILHVESSMKGLGIVFAGIPPEFTARVDQNALLEELTRHLADLRSAESYAEFSTLLTDRIYPGLQSLANALIVAINQNIAAYANDPAMLDLTAKLQALLRMPENFDLIKWQIEFQKICEHYIAYTNRARELSLFGSQSEEKSRGSQSALEVRFDPLSAVVADSDAFAGLSGAFTKSTKHVYVKPDTKKHDLAVVQAQYPQYPKLREILEDLDFKLGTNQMANALILLKQLPPQVIRDLSKYCSVHQAMLNTDFKNVVIAAKNMSDADFVKTYNPPVEEEKKVEAPQPLPSSIPQIKQILADLRKAHHDSAIVGAIISRLSELNAPEFIAMLKAEQLAVVSVSEPIAGSLLKCINAANAILKVQAMDTRNDYFREAKELLTFADRMTPAVSSEKRSAYIKFSLIKSETDPSPFLRRAAMLMVKLSLIEKSMPLPKEMLNDLQLCLQAINDFCGKTVTKNPELNAKLTSLSLQVQTAINSDSMKLGQGGGR